MATQAKVDRFQLRRSPRAPIELYTFGGEFVTAARAQLSRRLDADIAWPTGPGSKYYDDPVLFAVECLGVTDLTCEQQQILMALARNERVGVRSGRKVGKTKVIAIAAAWWYCTRVDAQVLMTAVTAHQIDNVMWREFRMTMDRAVVPIDGTPNIRAHNGMSSPTGFRSVRGFSPKDREAAAGVSGVAILYLFDESSGVPDEIYDTARGNMAGGGCKMLLTTNPTRNEGFLFNLFHGKQFKHLDGNGEHEGTALFTISSESTPNVQRDEIVIPGLATRKWIGDMAAEYGTDSADYIVHVLGRHALGHEARVFTIAMLAEAGARWFDTEADGGLVIGVDPAGDTSFGDRTGVATRRGLKLLEVAGQRGLDENQIGAWVERLAEQYQYNEREPVSIVFDVGGEIGAKLLLVMRVLAAKHRNWMLYPIRSSDNSVRFKQNTERRSAELVWNMRTWLNAGGAIPPDADDLVAEFRAWEFYRKSHDDERVKVDKNEVRKRLNRSPDLFDACALACWDAIPSETNRAINAGTTKPPKGSVVSRPKPVYPGTLPPGALDPFDRRRQRV